MYIEETLYKIFDNYPENFIFINGSRSIGKTYSTQKYILNKCINDGYEFVYLCRTQKEKKSNVFEQAFTKVIDNEFKNYEFDFTTETLKLDKNIIGYCFALTEMTYIKRRSFQNVKYILFDEYLTENNNNYINGNNEPNIVLNIYHTIDRDNDKVKMIFLGNNTYFYNPYHLHNAFNLTSYNLPNKIYHKNNVIFYNAITPDNVKSIKANSKFAKMINDTNYGNYANQGIYSDNLSLIKKLSNQTSYLFTLFENSKYYGIYVDKKSQCIIISNKISNNYPKYTTDFKMCNDKINLITKQHYMIKFISKYFKSNLLFFETQQIKSELNNFLKFIM